MTRTYELTIEGASFDARVHRVRGREQIHAPFRFEVTFEPLSDGAATAIDPKALLTQKASLSWGLPDGGTRTVEGYVEEIESFNDGIMVAIAPKIAFLDEAIDHRVFLEKDALEIIEAVLSEHGITVDARVDRALPKRAQCVQAFESDLDFVLRLAAEEGATLYLPYASADGVVLTDQPSGYDDVEGAPTFQVRQGGGLNETAESVFDTALHHATVPDKVTLRDYNFEKPLLDQTASADAGSSAREVYEHPGGYGEPSLGATLAQIRLDQLRAERTTLTGKTTSGRLAPGHVIELSDPDRGLLTGRWLLLAVKHEGDDYSTTGEEGRRYTATFTAVPADASYRAPRRPAPTFGGVQTGTITGAPGSEIHTEQHGRVKVHLRWDRLSPNDDTSSTYVRVVMPPTSGGFFLPRTGWEELLMFQDGSPDTPYAVGRLMNGQAPPGSSLPGKKVVSAFGTATTPGGGSANLIAMDDTAGNEGMTFNASKDWNERTENDKTTTVTANDSSSVGASRKLIVGQVLSVTVGGAQSYTIGGSRTVNTTSNMLIGSASETVMIGGLRTFNIGGDYKTGASSLTRLVGGAKAETAIESIVRSVTGAQTVLIGGSWRTVAGVSHNVGVTGAATELVAGAKSIKASKYALNVKGAYNETLASRSVTAGGDVGEQFAAAASYNVGASATLKGSEITIKATAKITIKAGGVTITITSGAIKIDGDFKSSVESNDAGDQTYGD
ncbi:MAG: type VI secretion system tip protein TssI/VgrG [Byssovorax sp.]